MKAVVTGGAGFIGSHLVERLVLDGYDVVVIDNLSTGHIENLDSFKSKITFENVDISEAGTWHHLFDGASYVFHLAALADIVPSIQSPRKYFKSNVDGTFNVLEAVKDKKIKKLVYSASSSCYGVPKVYPTPEDAKIDPMYPYALTKYLGENLVIHWSKVYKIPSISLRFFNVYGPRSRTSGTYGAMFGVFLAQKLANKPFTIVGDGDQTRDFTFVTDVVDAILCAAEKPSISRIYNVGSGATVSVNKVVDILKGDKVYIPKRPGEPDSTFADISLITKDLGWVPKINIQNGIDILLENIDYWKKAPIWEPDSIKEATKDWFLYLGKS